jgi:hypothetical protein
LFPFLVKNLVAGLNDRFVGFDVVWDHIPVRTTRFSCFLQLVSLDAYCQPLLGVLLYAAIFRGVVSGEDCMVPVSVFFAGRSFRRHTLTRPSCHSILVVLLKRAVDSVHNGVRTFASRSTTAQGEFWSALIGGVCMIVYWYWWR